MVDESDGEEREEMVSSKNKMGYLACTSYVVGNIIGSGIFITPATILNYTQSVGLSLVVWLGCGIISIIGAICYIELGTSILEPGCDFAYTVYVGWQGVAFSFMWVSCLMTYPASGAVQAQTFGQYIITGLAPLVTIEEPWNEIISKSIGFVAIFLLTGLNFYSIDRFAARFQVIVTVAKVIIVGIIICTGLYCLIILGQTENLSHMFDGSVYEPGKLALAFYGGLWSYAGWDILNYGTPEIHKPRRTMPLALITGILTVCAIYVLINLSYFVVLTPDEMKNSTAVAADFAQATLGDFSYAIPFMIAVLLIGTLNSNIFCGSRFMHAAARRGHLPPFLSAINQESSSPRAALLGQLVCMVVVSFVGIETLINYVTFVMWGQRVVTICALLYLKYTKMEVAPGAIRVPVVLTVVFLLISVALVVIPFVTETKVTLIGVVFVFSGLIFYLLLVRPQSSPRILTVINDFLSSWTCKILRSELDLVKFTAVSVNEEEADKDSEGDRAISPTNDD